MPSPYRIVEPIEKLRERFEYEPQTGRIYNKISRKYVGGLVSKRVGYLCVWFKNRRILSHRLAWALHYGAWVMPPFEIDHINRVRTDNRIDNLRIVTRSGQMRNTTVAKTADVPVVGVCPCRQTGLYKATITVDKKQIWLGRHKTIDAAIQARKEAERQHGWPQ